MAVELTKTSVATLCKGIDVPKPIVQLLGCEIIPMKNGKKICRIVLSDGLHMNSYFYVSFHFGDLIKNKQVKFGTLLRLEEYKFIDGENVTNHDARVLVFIQNMTILINRDIFGDPRPLINLEKEKKPLTNLNQTSCATRNFYNLNELRNSLITILDLYSMPNGKCSFVLKLTVSVKYPIRAHNDTCKILNITMSDSMNSLVNVSAFNSFAYKMNEIFEVNKKYYITDFKYKRDLTNELQFQANSVIIESTEEPIDENNFDELLKNYVNTFSDLIGVCYDIGQVEMVDTSSEREVPKLNISLIDKSMKTLTLKVWGENVKKFAQKFDEPPVVLIKQAVLKEYKGFKFYSMVKYSELIVNPNTDIALKLKQWYNEKFNNSENDISTLQTTFNFN